ncbi:MAG: replication protein P [Caudoviricetes sp.]|nr:MAG: replication protein P [Caudoviricetes sp.]
MMELSKSAPAVIHEVKSSAPAGDQVSPGVKSLFLLLQGYYGNLFLSKFSTGVKDSQNRDLGIRAAMKVWEAALSKFPPFVIETAAKRLTAEHPEFPPNLPQFVKSCEAAMPRKTFAQEQGFTALPAPTVEPIKVDLQDRNDGKDWARRILYRVERNDKSVSPYAHREARLAMGLEGRQSWH